MFNKKTIKDVPLDGQRVLLRADFNVPIAEGRVADDYRIAQTVPTIKHLLDRGCSVVICSHLGRPKGEVRPEFSLEPVAARLGDLLEMPVRFISDCVGDLALQAAKRLQPGQVLLLENLRFHPQEETNNAQFAAQLAKASGATYFVQDGFGVVHRAHASTEAITHSLPSVAGLLLETEVATITAAMQSPEHPLTAILGGAKISDKIKLVERFVDIADQLMIGGAMANTFLAYKGSPIGKSIFEPGQEPVLDQIYAKVLQKAQSLQKSVEEFLLLPVDVVVAKSLNVGATTRMVSTQAVEADEYILDIGMASAKRIADQLAGAKTVIWNGTLGMAEQPAYAHASALVAKTLAQQKDRTLTIVGGGDTADFVLHWDSQAGASFGHVSTGGGASLELMAGDKLPGIEALLDR